MACSLTLSSKSVSLLYWRAWNWTQRSECGPTSAEERGKIISIDLLATLLLMQPRIPLSFLVARLFCWLTFKLVSTKPPGAFWSTYFPASLLPASLYWQLGLFLTTCRTLHFSFLYFRRFLLSYFSAVHDPLNVSTDIWSISRSSKLCITC